jgi:hypothetical protein
MTACNTGYGVEITAAETTTAATEGDTTAEDTAEQSLEQSLEQSSEQTTEEEETFAADSRWNSATYKKDTQLGEGANKIKVVVKTDDHQITLTVNTDKDNLGDALFELGIINDPSFFDTVNGMRLDWNTDKAYWGFYKSGEYMMVGVNDAPVVGVEQYELVYTKG